VLEEVNFEVSPNSSSDGDTFLDARNLGLGSGSGLGLGLGQGLGLGLGQAATTRSSTNSSFAGGRSRGRGRGRGMVSSLVEADEDPEKEGLDELLASLARREEDDVKRHTHVITGERIIPSASSSSSSSSSSSQQQQQAIGSGRNVPAVRKPIPVPAARHGAAILQFHPSSSSSASVPSASSPGAGAGAGGDDEEQH